MTPGFADSWVRKEQLERQRHFYRCTPKSKNTKNILRASPLVRQFCLRVLITMGCCKYTQKAVKSGNTEKYEQLTKSPIPGCTPEVPPSLVVPQKSDKIETRLENDYFCNLSVFFRILGTQPEMEIS